MRLSVRIEGVLMGWEALLEGWDTYQALVILGISDLCSQLIPRSELTDTHTHPSHL